MARAGSSGPSSSSPMARARSSARRGPATMAVSRGAVMHAIHLYPPS
jgi:hypothetical protein